MDLVERPDPGFRRHPWEVVRAEFFEGILAPVLGRDPVADVLDAGAGDGWFARRLLAAHPTARVTCFDPGYGGSAAVPEPDGSGRLRYTAQRPSESFSTVLLLDVLEHIDDDRHALATLVADNLRPGGNVLISVPAWQRLFSAHDVRLHHHRRYSPRAIREVIDHAGLELERDGGLFHSLLPARAAGRLRERLAPPRRADAAGHALEWRGGRATSRLVADVLRADARLSAASASAGVRLPGLSWWGLCRKP